MGGAWCVPPASGCRVLAFQLTPEWREKTEFALARLMFPSGPLNGYRGRDANWHAGTSHNPSAASPAFLSAAWSSR
jgi:hypothetical protein